MVSHAPAEVALCLAVGHQTVQHRLGRIAVAFRGPTVREGTQDRSLGVILADEVVADAHRLDVAVQIALHRLVAHVGPDQALVHLVVHDPVVDVSERLAGGAVGMRVARHEERKGGRILVEAFRRSDVRHGVVTSGILRILVDRAGSRQEDGGENDAALVGLGHDGIRRVAAGRHDLVILSAVRGPRTAARHLADDSLQGDVHRDAAESQVIHLLIVGRTGAGTQALLVLQRHGFGCTDRSHFIGVAGVGIQFLDPVLDLDDGPFREETVVGVAFPAVDIPVQGDGEAATGQLRRIREDGQFRYILPGRDFGQQIGPAAGADAIHGYLVRRDAHVVDGGRIRCVQIGGQAPGHGHFLDIIPGHDPFLLFLLRHLADDEVADMHGPAAVLAGIEAEEVSRLAPSAVPHR